MNVFVLSEDVNQSAQLLFALDSVRARKQIVELCQMIACVVPFKLPKKDGTDYTTPKQTVNHPATKWVTRNLKWCIDYVKALRKEYGKEHGCDDAIEILIDAYRNHECLSVQFEWISKKVSPDKLIGRQIESNYDFFLANKLYIEAKQRGLYGN